VKTVIIIQEKLLQLDCQSAKRYSKLMT